MTVLIARAPGASLFSSARAFLALASLLVAALAVLAPFCDAQAAFRQLGQKLPNLWPTEVLSRTPKKALLRCLLDKGVVQRVGREQVQIRIGWRGGDVMECVMPIPVKSLAALATSQELEARV